MKIFWLQLTHTSQKQILDQLEADIAMRAHSKKQEAGKVIFTPNPEILLRQDREKDFRDILLQADMLIPDGIGLYIGAQMLEYKYWWLRIVLLPYFFARLFLARPVLYKKYGNRICGSDLTRDILEYAQDHGLKIAIIDPYFPDDLPKVASQQSFEENLKKVFPWLDFGFFIYREEHKVHIISDIQSSQSQILFSTLGMKTQEQSVLDLMQQCPSIALGLWVGSSFDYFTGFQKRAPQIFSTLGLEWCYRLATSPNKKRQLQKVWNAIFVFLWRVVWEK